MNTDDDVIRGNIQSIRNELSSLVARAARQFSAPKVFVTEGIAAFHITISDGVLDPTPLASLSGITLATATEGEYSGGEEMRLFGHWSKHRLADGVFLPLACYAPTGPDYTTVPLYALSSTATEGSANV